MNTMSNYDSIDKALNTSSAIDVTPTSKPQKVESTKDDVKKAMTTLVQTYIR